MSFRIYGQTSISSILALTSEQSKNIDYEYLNFIDKDTPVNGPDGSGKLYKKTGNDGLFWLPDSAGIEVDLTSTVAGNDSDYTITNINTTPYTVLSTDEVVMVDTTGGVITLTLPIISALPYSPKTMSLTVSDSGGLAVSNNIIINRGGSDTIMGDTSVVINNNYNSITFITDGVSNWIIT